MRKKDEPTLFGFFAALVVVGATLVGVVAVIEMIAPAWR